MTMRAVPLPCPEGGSADRLPPQRAPPPGSDPRSTPESVGPERRPPPRLLDRVRAAAKVRHLSPRTETAYLGWIRRFICFTESATPTRRAAVRSARSCRLSPPHVGSVPALRTRRWRRCFSLRGGPRAQAALDGRSGPREAT